MTIGLHANLKHFNSEAYQYQQEIESMISLINQALNEKSKEDIDYIFHFCAQDSNIISSKHLSFSFYQSNKHYPGLLSF